MLYNKERKFRTPRWNNQAAAANPRLVSSRFYSERGTLVPYNAYIYGTSVFGFAYAVTGKSRAPTDMPPPISGPDISLFSNAANASEQGLFLAGFGAFQVAHIAAHTGAVGGGKADIGVLALQF